MTPLADTGVSRVYHATWQQTLEVVRAEGGCDTLIVDAPYSAVTHEGHDGAASAGARRELDYLAWSADDARAFVEAWSPLVRGWIVSLTDDRLFGAWRAAMADAGRQVFQDVPAVIRGMSCRMRGDGPSSWAVHVAVSRPRTLEMARWGTRDGAYVGARERQPVVGGKPIWLMRALVEDYSRPGDLVVDPCCGGGTTILAAQQLGRRAIGGDAMREHADIAAERIRPVPAQSRAGTLALFAPELVRACAGGSE